MPLSVRVCWGLLVIALGGLLAPRAGAAVGHLTLQSEPGDYIGQGGTFDITYSDTIAQVRRSLPSGQPAELLFVQGPLGPNDHTPFSSLSFGTDALGIPMQPGVYQDAQRADLAESGHPGLDVDFQDRGCNGLTGSFTVTDATFAADHSIISFSASFEQHCEGAMPALFGTYTYAVPEPSGITLLAIGTACLIRRRSRTA